MEHLPRDIINHILEFDGTIRYKNGEYINTIHPHDVRYTIISPLIKKKEMHHCAYCSRQKGQLLLL